MQAQNAKLERAYQARGKKGVKIVVSGDSEKRLSKNLNKVKPQSGSGWYRVAKTEDADAWSCSCPDFSYRLVRMEDERCKHIRAVLTLQKTLEREPHIEKLDFPKICPQCESTEIVKNGLGLFRIMSESSGTPAKQRSYNFSLSSRTV